ncbi:penicillin-binding transpeptidase domain-containing protein [Actinobacillus pleuropneumoniae]|uniref:Peptidoglycan D,D-transpeptidase FtsI n=3 Tax=Actinobacillus pleuropneumoniae TaxID=715 RepID=B0BRH1_ACTPJ|nr:penicillin-binding transpeptidase domain-containing protein [Actinobacillus pleuropneumoniae]ABY68619.1 penicillin-binding protein 3 [Actinobacillus pleuropneumoniae serovar 3 str. JL03]MBT9318874.1 cell division protein FtsI [Actinobacillus pleuropneumoniae]MBT9343434.1 cell division protein FtsI [Actinobacillus pleuropneumoniae]MCL7721315.1 cell division protein FtsI [Actinobacillus pleuropneumoniae]MCL7727355.1 cell division protein FtsI [Actinobacillus pleuropneumoniae]
MAKSVKLKRKPVAIEPNTEVKKQTNTKNEPSYLPIRFGVVGFFILVMAGMLIAKAAHIQLFDSERLINEANNRSLRTKELPFTRGRILDRNGRFLSISVPMYSLTLDPREYFDSKLRRSPERWKLLAMEMGASKSKIEKNVNDFIEKKNTSKEKVAFDPRSILNTKSEDYWTLLAQSTGLDYNTLIQSVRNNPSSAFLMQEISASQLERSKLEAIAKATGEKYNDLMARLYKASRQRFIYIARHEPESIANYAQELKIDGMVLKAESRRFYPLAEEASQLIGFTDIDDVHGTEGLERSFDSLLIGKNGRQVIRKDARGNVIENIRDEKQYDPQDVMLSIDEELQSEVYKKIKEAVIANNAESGTAVLVDVQTGEILAMANAPSFNPNKRDSFKPELMRNRAITDTFEPGSTVKPLVVLTALQNGATYRDEVINTRPFVVNGHTIKDVAPRESLSLTGILQKSSNIGVSRLALRMPSTALVDTYSKVGFGKDTGLGLGEQKGTNGDRKRWSDIERATMAYGYGLNITPLQLARAYATLGSFGIYRPLSITKVDPPVIGERVLPEKITRDVVHMMESVAQKGEGGQKAMVEGYRVAVKTGTARKLEKGQYVEKYIAYTAGVAPASDPRFALVVLINEPKAGQYYGGSVSAPLFSSIMGYTLKTRNIKPDNLTDTESAVREIKLEQKVN